MIGCKVEGILIVDLSYAPASLSSVPGRKAKVTDAAGYVPPHGPVCDDTPWKNHGRKHEMSVLKGKTIFSRRPRDAIYFVQSGRVKLPLSRLEEGGCPCSARPHAILAGMPGRPTSPPQHGDGASIR